MNSPHHTRKHCLLESSLKAESRQRDETPTEKKMWPQTGSFSPLYVFPFWMRCYIYLKTTKKCITLVSKHQIKKLRTDDLRTSRLTRQKSANLKQNQLLLTECVPVRASSERKMKENLFLREGIYRKYKYRRLCCMLCIFVYITHTQGQAISPVPSSPLDVNFYPRWDKKRETFLGCIFCSLTNP